MKTHASGGKVKDSLSIVIVDGRLMTFQKPA